MEELDCKEDDECFIKKFLDTPLQNESCLGGGMHVLVETRRW